MQIAFLCHRVPYPPDKGDKIRAFHQLRAMASAHEVDLFTLANEDSSLDGLKPLSAFCRRVEVVRLKQWAAKMRALPRLLSRVPLTLPYFHSVELGRKIDSALRTTQYDRIYVYCSAMWQYVSHAGAIPVITDLVDIDSDKWRQYAEYTSFPMSAVYAREARYLRTFEHLVCRKSAAIVVTTEREAALAAEICPEANVCTISNGVDQNYFYPASAQAYPPAVVFTGDMSYFPNQDAVAFFAREVLPRIRQSVPEARFLIVGRNPGPRVQMLRDIPGVEVTGFVPDVRTYLHQARVAVAPFRVAAGIQNKILEAMSCAVPVVATPKAGQALVREVREAVDEAATTEEFASKVIDILLDENTGRSKGTEARRRVAAHYNWDRSLAHLLELVRTCRLERSKLRHATG